MCTVPFSQAHINAVTSLLWTPTVFHPNSMSGAPNRYTCGAGSVGGG